MANALDLEEQEQLDQIRHFWKKYGNLISWVLIAVLGSYAAWNGYQYWQRSQAAQAAVMYDEVERAAQRGVIFIGRQAARARKIIHLVQRLRALQVQQFQLGAVARLAVEIGRAHV